MDQIVWNMVPIVTGILIVVLGFIRFRQYRQCKKNYVKSQKERNLNQELTTVAMSLTVLGIIFGADNLISYSFTFAGILISIITLIKHKKMRARIHKYANSK